MINLIIGQNASGKTLYLRNKLKELYSKGVITNLIDDPNLESNTNFNSERLEVLRDITDSSGIEVKANRIWLKGNDEEYTETFLKLARDMCVDYKLMMLDEPDRGISAEEQTLLNKFLAYTTDTFEEVYIVTHSSLPLALPRKEIYTVLNKHKNNVELTRVNREDCYEIML